MGVEIPVGYGDMAFRYSLDGDPEEMLTTIGFRAVAGDDLSSLQAAAADVYNAWRNEVVDISGSGMSPDWLFLGVRYTVNADPNGLLTFEEDSVITGTTVGETIPNNVALLVRKTTALGGKKNRGRMYLPPVDTTAAGVTPQGDLSAVYRANWQARLTAFLTEVESLTTAELVVLHSDPLQVPTPITNLVMGPRLATQRRRLRP